MRESDAGVIEASLVLPMRFAEIFDRHASSVRRFVERRASVSVVDDVVAEVFRLSFERRSTFDPGFASALPWLYGIALNVLRHQQRSWTREAAAVRRLGGRGDRALDPLLDVAQRLDASRGAAALLDALETLRPDDRDVLLLVAWEQLAPAEIAVVLDVPATTVRTRLHRARRMVREIVGHDEEAVTDGHR